MNSLNVVNEILMLWNEFQDDLLELIKDLDYDTYKEIEEILTNENEHTLTKIIRTVQQ